MLPAGWRAPPRVCGTRFVWGGDVLAEEIPILETGELALDRRVEWAFEDGSFTPLARLDAAGTSFVVADHLGTPRELVSAQGEMPWAARLRLWGSARRAWRRKHATNDDFGAATTYAFLEEEVDLCPHRFPGQYEDAEMGLYYNRHRHYDPLAGGYVSPDPIGLAGGDQPNGYVERPGCWCDPQGLVKTSDFVYRVIRDDENPLSGLTPKDPKAETTPNDHVRIGSRIKTKFISITRSEAVAKQWVAKDGKRYLKIDLSKSQSKVIDPLADGLLTNPLAKSFAKASQELLVDGPIPAGAIEVPPQLRN